MSCLSTEQFIGLLATGAAIGVALHEFVLVPVMHRIVGFFFDNINWHRRDR